MFLIAFPAQAQAPTTPLEATTSPVTASLDTKAEYVAYATETAQNEGVSVQQVLGTIGCESHWDATAVSPTHDFGLSQINQPSWHFSTTTMFDPKFSIDFMVHQFKLGHAYLWTCWRDLYM